MDESGWWRALSLAERRRGTPRLDDEDREYGRLRHEVWASGALSGGRSISLERWERTGLSASDLVELLGEPTSSLAERLDPPDWLPIIETAWREYGREPNESRPAQVVDILNPLLRWAMSKLDIPNVEPPTAQLAKMLAPTAALEINVAREEGRLRADSSEAAYAEFCERLRQPTEALAFLLEYPVLAGELVGYLRDWIDVRREFATRLATDLPDLRTTFGLTSTQLTDVRFGAGDSHRGGRSVAILEFADGQRLVYKPRNVDADLHYSAFLRWLNQHGLTNSLRTLEILPREEYGWVEYVAARPCADSAEVERFFWRQGACLALFYALCGADLHHENVIAAGEHPVVVDVEALLQATPRMFGLADAEPLLSAAMKAARDSVLRVGLLPSHVIRVGEDGAYGADISGLTGGGGELSMLPVLVLRDRGTDRMRMARERLPLDESANRAMLDDRPADLVDHREHLVAGFDECYRILLRHRAELLADHGPLHAFRDARVRTLLRPTATYAKLLGESWHPDLLRDALDREHLFESLSIALKGIDERDQLVQSEVRQLSDRDIPLFDTGADSLDLYDGAGLVLPNFFESSGLTAARNRITALSEDDLARQCWFIQASLTGLTVGEFATTRERTNAALPTEPIDLELATNAAALVADRLLDSALTDETNAVPSWLSVGFVGDRYWRVAPTGTDLYSGLSGIGLFLAELDAVHPDRSYREPATRIATHLCDLADYLAKQEILASTLGGGGFTGLAGLAYAFQEFGRLWDDSDLTERAYGLALDCVEACQTEKICDLLGGLTGTALVFAGLHRKAPSEPTRELLDVVRRTLIERRIDFDDGTTAWPTDMETNQPLLGLSHGTSGIALALATIAELTDDPQASEIAVRGLRFERARLSREHGNWPDLRSFVAGTTYRDSWCHGAAGIGLARAALLESPTLEPIRDLIIEDLTIAATTVRRDLLGNGLGNDSLCHGDLGLIETLGATADATDQPDLALLARRSARTVANRVLAGELRCGTPDGLTTPGLMLGVAGIGYGLLRAAVPDRVPNVLLLRSAS